MILLADKYFEIKNTRNKGRGVFANKEISKSTVIGDYIGKVIHPEDALVDENNFYLIYYHDYAVISPDLNKSGVQLLNHSCRPNAFIYIYRGHTLVFTLRKIKKGEEITISYLLPPKEKYCNPCLHKCSCGFSNCNGTMHLSKEKFELWKKLNNKQAKETKKERIKYGKELSLLSFYPKNIPYVYIKRVNKIFEYV